jgi:hypothetical protein
MDLFTDYLHTDNDEKLADYLYPISKKYLEKTPTDERYKNGKTTFYNRNSNDYYKEELNPLINFIFKNAIKYLDVIKIDIKKNYLHLTDLWFSEMYMYGSHELHAHATEDLSGNFYIHCEEKSSSIKFFKPGFYYNKMTTRILESTRVKGDGKYTHTSMHHPRGKFNITDKDTFWKTYSIDLKNSEKFGITEVPLCKNEMMPIISDIDIKIPKDEMPGKMLEKLYEMQIQSVIIEGGRFTLQQFIDANLWDEAIIIKNENLQLENGTKAPTIAAEIVRTAILDDNEVDYYKNSAS